MSGLFSGKSRLAWPVVWSFGMLSLYRSGHLMASEVINGENSYGTIESPIMSFLVGGPPGEGTFGFWEDHVKLGNVLTGFLQRLVLHYLEQGHFAAYRFYLNLQSVYLRGFPVHTDLFHPVPAEADVEAHLESSESLAATFLFQHGFKKVNQIDTAGWSPLCYAALRGDALVVRSLLEARADPSDKVRKNEPLFGMQKGVSALALALYFSNNKSAQVLIEARANLSLSFLPPLCSAAFANNVDEGIRMVCQAVDRPWEQTHFGLHCVLFAAGTSSVEAIRELMVQSQGMNVHGSLVAAMLYNRGTAELVEELVKAKADVNENQNPFGLFFGYENLRYICGARTPAARLGHLSFGATPLMFAIGAGQYEGAAALIVAKANLDAVNYRKQTALDLAQEFGAPQFLVDALQNNPAVCRRMIASALTNRYLVQEKF